LIKLKLLPCTCISIWLASSLLYSFFHSSDANSTMIKRFQNNV
jgi:hypothetical protein